MHRRKNFLINKRFQFTFLAPFVVLLVLESVLIVGLFFYLSQDTLTTGYVDSILRVERTQNFFLVPFLLVTLIAALGLAMTGMVVFAVLSHRLAGPVYRFEKVLEQVEGGNLTTRVHLRKTDQFTDMEKAMNRFIVSLNRRVGGIKMELEEAKKILAKKDDPTVLTKIGEKINAISEDIKHFKVTPESNDEE